MAEFSIVGKGEYVSPSWERGSDHVAYLFNRNDFYFAFKLHCSMDR